MVCECMLLKEIGVFVYKYILYEWFILHNIVFIIKNDMANKFFLQYDFVFDVDLVNSLPF